MSTDIKHTNYIPYHRAYQMYTTIHYHQTYQLYHYPLLSNLPIIPLSTTIEHTNCIPLSITIKHTNQSTTIKHIFYMGYKWTYQQYPPSLSIPIISASIEHTNDIHNHWLKPIIPYSLHSNIPIISTTIEHTNYTTIHYPWTYQFIHYHRTHRLPLNIPSITGGRGLNIERFVVHMSTVMCWKSSRYWTIFLLC